MDNSLASRFIGIAYWTTKITMFARKPQVTSNFRGPTDAVLADTTCRSPSFPCTTFFSTCRVSRLTSNAKSKRSRSSTIVSSTLPSRFSFTGAGNANVSSLVVTCAPVMNASFDDSNATCAPPPRRNLAIPSCASASHWAVSSSLSSYSSSPGSTGIFINFLRMAFTLRPCFLANLTCHARSVSRCAASSSSRSRSLLGRVRSPPASGPSGSPLWRRRSLAAMMPRARRSSNSTCDSLWRLPRRPSQRA